MKTVLTYFLTGVVLAMGALVQIETLRQGVTTAVGSDPPRGDHPERCVCPTCPYGVVLRALRAVRRAA